MGQWKSIVYAPLNRDAEVLVTDGVKEYRSGICYRTDDGWMRSKLNTPLPLRLRVLAWREPE